MIWVHFPIPGNNHKISRFFFVFDLQFACSILYSVADFRTMEQI